MAVLQEKQICIDFALASKTINIKLVLIIIFPNLRARRFRLEEIYIIKSVFSRC